MPSAEPCRAGLTTNGKPKRRSIESSESAAPRLRNAVSLKLTNAGVGMPVCCRWREVLNTDSAFYGGSGAGNLGGVEAEAVPWHEQPFSAALTLPPLGAVWLAPE